MNRVDLTGRITKDPEVKVTQQSNTSICVFSIACRRSYKNSKGEYDVDYIRCVAYRTSADYLGKYIHKGDLLEVSGAVRQYSYKGEDGKDHVGLEVCIDSKGDVRCLQRKQQNAEATDALGECEPLDEDIPF